MITALMIMHLLYFAFYNLQVAILFLYFNNNSNWLLIRILIVL
jgi:hypothetical protein